jgi:hypothetical protein
MKFMFLCFLGNAPSFERVCSVGQDGQLKDEFQQNRS